MLCKVCGNNVTQLFTTVACDYCDFGPKPEACHFGFIVLRDDVNVSDSPEEYVFRTKLDGECWREASGRQQAEVKKVYSLKPFHWHLSRGTLRDVMLATTMYIVHSDHRFSQTDSGHHCWIAPENK